MKFNALKFKQLRENKGLTQKQLSDLLGYTNSGVVANIELGKRGMSMSKVCEVAELFNVTIDELFSK